MTNPETIQEFFGSRRDFFQLTVTKNARGDWDVWLRIDGSYAEEANALDAADHFKRAIDALE